MRDEALEALDQALVIRRAGQIARKQGEPSGCGPGCSPARVVPASPGWRRWNPCRCSSLSPHGRELARAYGQLAEIAMRADACDEAIGWGRQAVALAERIDDAEALAFGLNNIGATSWRTNSRAAVNASSRASRSRRGPGSRPRSAGLTSI